MQKHKLLSKSSNLFNDFEQNAISSINQGRNSVVTRQNLPAFNSKTILPTSNPHAKFKENRSKMLKKEGENEFITSIKGHNLFVIDEIYPSAIPNHSFVISTLVQSLKKIGKNLFNIESGNEALMDGQADVRTDRRTDGRTDGGHSNANL